MAIQDLTQDAISLLKKLIETQSFSSKEDVTATHIEDWFKRYNVDFKRTKNNVWALNKHFDASKPTLLLNSSDAISLPTLCPVFDAPSLARI